MNSLFAFRQCIFTAILFALASTVHLSAGNQRWISGTGSDDNSCFISSPCHTIQYVLGSGAFPSGSFGEIDALNSGSFGGFTIGIPKSVTIDGGAGNIASIFQDSINVNSLNTGEVVIIRNLTLNGDTYLNNPAIQFSSSPGGTLIIENCKIYNFNTTAISITSGNNVIIKDTIIESNGGDAININVEGILVSLSNVSIKNNTGNGLNVSNGIVDISDSIITQNGNAAILATGTNTLINCMNNVLTSNGTALSVGSNGTIRISNNDIYNNGVFLDNEGGSVVTANNNRTGSNGNNPEPPTGSVTIQ